MKISERIMSQLEEPAAGDDSWVDGFVSATESAAQIATEADALMAEMAEALEVYAELERIEGEGANRATKALKHYQEYVK